MDMDETLPERGVFILGVRRDGEAVLYWSAAAVGLAAALRAEADGVTVAEFSAYTTREAALAKVARVEEGGRAVRAVRC